MGEASFSGRCHCGNLELTFTTAGSPDNLVPRCCMCAFCRRHGARCVSDPQGRVAIVVHDPALLIRYRFGLRTADFLLCGRCGTYIGAAMATDGTMVATINANSFDPPLQGEGLPMRYDAETGPERRARRAARWTPASIVTGADKHGN